MDHGATANALQHLAAAIDDAPDDFWSRYQQMRAYYELARFDEALGSATVCIALEPEQAECYYNRALCHQALGHATDAHADLDRALKHDPKLAAASLARGALRIDEHQFADAKRDFESALEQGSRSSEVYYQLARLEMAQHDSAKAGQWARKASEEDPTNASAKALLKQLESN
jgi:tetratricopeptide (TPR) repeat protein